MEQITQQALPPYVVKDSLVAKEWFHGEYANEVPGAPGSDEDWGQHEAHDAAGGGDLDALIEIAKQEQHALHAIDNNGWQPIHEAVRGGNEDVIEFLKEQGADFNAITDSEDGYSVLDIAIREWGAVEPEYIDWLRSLGATMSRLELGPEL